jgi:hypothetical protein
MVAMQITKAIGAPSTSTRSTSSNKELVIIRIAADDNLLAPQVLSGQLSSKCYGRARGGSGWLLTKLAVNSAKSKRMATVRTMTAHKTPSAQLHTLAPSHAQSLTLFRSSTAPLPVFSCGCKCQSHDSKARQTTCGECTFLRPTLGEFRCPSRR